MTEEDFYNPDVISGHLIDSLLKTNNIALTHGIMNTSEYIRGINIDLLYQREPITENDLDFDRYTDNSAKLGVIDALNKLREIQVYGSIQNEISNTNDNLDNYNDEVLSFADDLKYADEDI